MPSLDHSDIQGLVTRGYPRARYACFSFFRILDSAAAKSWIAKASVHLTSVSSEGVFPGKPHTHANLAITARGLRLLGLTEDTMGGFPREFLVGMQQRAQALGDIGPNQPEKWTFGGPRNPEFHLLLMLYASSGDELAELSQFFELLDSAGALERVFNQNSLRENEFEPFGFRDGISQPAIEVPRKGLKPGQSLLKPGEFVLGYPNEYGLTPPTLPIAGSEERPEPLLPSLADTRFGDFDATEVAPRKLRGCGRFNLFSRKGEESGWFSGSKMADFMKAKCMGRWPNGAPLVLAWIATLPPTSIKSKSTISGTRVRIRPARMSIGSHIGEPTRAIRLPTISPNRIA